MQVASFFFRPASTLISSALCNLSSSLRPLLSPRYCVASPNLLLFCHFFLARRDASLLSLSLLKREYNVLSGNKQEKKNWGPNPSPSCLASKKTIKLQAEGRAETLIPPTRTTTTTCHKDPTAAHLNEKKKNGKKQQQRASICSYCHKLCSEGEIGDSGTKFVQEESVICSGNVVQHRCTTRTPWSCTWQREKVESSSTYTYAIHYQKNVQGTPGIDQTPRNKFFFLFLRNKDVESTSAYVRRKEERFL